MGVGGWADWGVGLCRCVLRGLVESRAFVLLRRASYFLLRGQEKVTKEKATPLGACRATPAKSVSRGQAFQQGSCPDEKESTSCRFPCGPVDHASPPHRGLEKQNGFPANSTKSYNVRVHCLRKATLFDDGLGSHFIDGLWPSVHDRANAHQF